MQMIVPFLLTLLFSAGALAGPLENKINQYEELEQLLERHCIRNADAAEVKVMVNGTELNCNHLMVLATRLKSEIDDEIEDLEESCSQEEQPAANQLAQQSAQIARQSVCRPQSTDLQCLGSFTCSLASKVGQSIPVFGRPISGMLRSCRGNYSAGGCLQSIAKGIFDALWGLVSSVWDIGKAAGRAIGEWTGIIRTAENSTTEKLMAAQRAGRNYVSKFIRSPIQTMRETASAIFNGVKQAAMSSYGCEQWSDPRRPFVSRCVRPMTNWNCATCQQKFQVMCGIAGMAIGEIPAALLTGGVAGGARAIARAASSAVRANARRGRVNRGVAGILSRFRPPAGLSRATETIARQTRRLTALEQRVIARWTRTKDSELARQIARSARAADEGDVREASRFRLRPVGFYVDAVEAAARLGFRVGDEAVSSVVGNNGARNAVATADAARIATAAHRINENEGNSGSMTDLQRNLPPEANDVIDMSADELRLLAGDTVDVTDELPQIATTESSRNVRLVEGAQVIPLIRRFSNNSSATSAVERLPTAPLPDPSTLLEARPDVSIPEFSADPQLPQVSSNNNNSNTQKPEVQANNDQKKEEEEEEDEEERRERRRSVAENDENNVESSVTVETRNEPIVSPTTTPETISPELARAATLTEPQRLSEAATLVGRALPQEQMDAVIRAHRVGEGTGRGFYTYTPEEIRQKGLILREAGFSADEIRLLVDRGITGSLPAPAAVASAASATLPPPPITVTAAIPTPTPRPVPAAVTRVEPVQVPVQVPVPARAPASVTTVEFSEARSSVVRASEIKRSLNQTPPGELQTRRVVEMRDEFRRAADGYAAEASRKNSAQFVGQSMWLYSKAGDSAAAARMAQLGIRQHGMDPQRIITSIDRELSLMRKDGATSNPGLTIERDTLLEVRRILSQQTAPVAQTRTAPVTSAKRPASPPPTQRTPSNVPARDAAMIANEYRLAGNPSEASRYYLRASLPDIVKEARRTKGMNEGSRYFDNRNISAAFHESLNGDGTVAREIIDSLAVEGRGAGINEFLYEMHQKNIYQQRSPAARLNMHRLVDHILDAHRTSLYNPQLNAVRGWKSYNPLN